MQKNVPKKRGRKPIGGKIINQNTNTISISEKPENISTTEFTDEEGEEFENMIGDILMALIYEQHKIIEEKKNAKNRDPDTLTFTI